MKKTNYTSSNFVIVISKSHKEFIEKDKLDFEIFVIIKL